MRHDWIDDILAVIDTGSFARAAELRHVTQSAFARRIEAIEAQVGGPLFDRNRKPIALRAEAQTLEAGLRRTRQAEIAMLQEVAEVATGGASLTLACMHAITTTISPGLIHGLSAAGLEPVRIRSVNRDECLFLLLSGEADLAVTYAPAGAPTEGGDGFAERRIGEDVLMPVARPGAAFSDDGVLLVIAYPSDAFLGTLVERLWRGLPAETVIRRRAETSLTLAAYRYVLDGMGAAWLPVSLIGEDLADGRLQRVEGVGPDLPLEVRIIRRSVPSRRVAMKAWEVILDGSEGLPERPAHGIEPLGRAE